MSWTKRFSTPVVAWRSLLYMPAACAADVPAGPVPEASARSHCYGRPSFRRASLHCDVRPHSGIICGRERYGSDAENVLKPAARGRYDALLFCDMNQEQGAHTNALEQILAQGKPSVFLHHVIGSYPDWTDYAQLVGGHAQLWRTRGARCSQHRAFARGVDAPRDRRSPASDPSKAGATSIGTMHDEAEGADY